MDKRSAILQGTLDLMVLKTLAAEADNWERVSGVSGRLLRLSTNG